MQRNPVSDISSYEIKKQLKIEALCWGVGKNWTGLAEKYFADFVPSKGLRGRKSSSRDCGARKTYRGASGCAFAARVIYWHMQAITRVLRGQFGGFTTRTTKSREMVEMPEKPSFNWQISD